MRTQHSSIATWLENAFSSCCLALHIAVHLIVVVVVVANVVEYANILKRFQAQLLPLTSIQWFTTLSLLLFEAFVAYLAVFLATGEAAATTRLRLLAWQPLNCMPFLFTPSLTSYLHFSFHLWFYCVFCFNFVFAKHRYIVCIRQFSRINYQFDGGILRYPAFGFFFSLEKQYFLLP